jgi:hypothetical protein
MGTPKKRSRMIMEIEITPRKIKHSVNKGKGGFY